jgi:hypothetical protein
MSFTVEMSDFIANTLQISAAGGFIVSVSSSGEFIWADNAEELINDDEHWNNAEHIAYWQPILKALWELKKLKEEKKKGWFLSSESLSAAKVNEIVNCISAAQMSRRSVQVKSDCAGEVLMSSGNWIKDLKEV